MGYLVAGMPFFRCGYSRDLNLFIRVVRPALTQTPVSGVLRRLPLQPNSPYGCAAAQRGSRDT